MAEDRQLYFGGEIYTGDDKCPSAEAVAVENGHITAVGSKDECRTALSKPYEAVDLEGAVLFPGFIDTHLHPPLMIIYAIGADLSDVDSIEALQVRLQSLAQTDSSSNWIMGFQFEEQNFKAPRLPTRHDLDIACPERPAILLKRDGHMIIANTKAIEAAGVAASTQDPQGGKIDREVDGFPAGPFRETAVRLLLAAMPLPARQTIVKAAATVFEKIASYGITSAGVILQTDEEGVAGAAGVYDLPLMEMVIDRIPVNLYSLLVAHDITPFEAARTSRLHREEIGAGHRVGALKFWADGSFASCSAYMNEPFTDQPDKRGFLIDSPEHMYQRMVMAHTAGLQLAIHSIGDASTRTVLDLFDRLLNAYPRPNHRHRLEHASQLDAGLIEDIARLNLVVATQPLFIHSEKSWLHKRLGCNRARWTYPLRSLFDAGIIVAGASDAPIESLNVMQAIQCCVTRDGFEAQQALSVEEAIRMFTINAAYAQFEESVKGSITAGKRADMVALDQNPVSVDPEDIRNIRVERTICNGKVIYQR